MGMVMQVDGFIQKYADVIFKPTGSDEFGVFMNIEGSMIHVRQDDVSLTEGMAIKEIWPLVDKLELHD